MGQSVDFDPRMAGSHDDIQHIEERGIQGCTTDSPGGDLEDGVTGERRVAVALKKVGTLTIRTFSW